MPLSRGFKAVHPKGCELSSRYGNVRVAFAVAAVFAKGVVEGAGDSNRNLTTKTTTLSEMATTTVANVTNPPYIESPEVDCGGHLVTWGPDIGPPPEGCTPPGADGVIGRTQSECDFALRLVCCTLVCFLAGVTACDSSCGPRQRFVLAWGVCVARC
jgi:hypothetical protein